MPFYLILFPIIAGLNGFFCKLTLFFHDKSEPKVKGRSVKIKSVNGVKRSEGAKGVNVT